jgi:hypothetical protein
MTASAIFDMQMSSPEFKKGLEAARAEFASLKNEIRQQPPDCEAQAVLLSKTLTERPSCWICAIRRDA